MIKKEKARKQIKTRCKKCNSGFTYIRLKTGEVVCRRCGNVSKLNRKEKR